MSDQRDGGIAWTDQTWNPVRGCSRVSAGCANCYAEKVAARFSGPGLPYEGLTRADGRWNGVVRLVPQHLADPLRWRRPRRVFVNSMSDLFHDTFPNEAIAVVFAVMAAAPAHTFQVLTKRASRMREWFKWAASEHTGGAMTPLRKLNLAAHELMGGRAPGGALIEAATWPLPNVWLGVSVEDQKTADERIPALIDTPAEVRFVSYEPALAPVDFAPWLRKRTRHHLAQSVNGALLNRTFDCFTEGGRPIPPAEAEAELRRLQANGVKLVPVESCDSFDPVDGCRGHRLPGLDWIIVGGESGEGARPFHVAWARSTIDACRAAGVACFVKQFGSDARGDRFDLSEHAFVEAEAAGWEESPNGRLPLRSRKGGDLSEWPEDLRVREFPRSKGAP
jgi:protein gp37